MLVSLGGVRSGLRSCNVSTPMVELLSTCVVPSLPRYMLLWSSGPTELTLWESSAAQQTPSQLELRGRWGET